MYEGGSVPAGKQNTNILGEMTNHIHKSFSNNHEQTLFYGVCIPYRVISEDQEKESAEVSVFLTYTYITETLQVQLLFISFLSIVDDLFPFQFR